MEMTLRISTEKIFTVDGKNIHPATLIFVIETEEEKQQMYTICESFMMGSFFEPKKEGETIIVDFNCYVPV